MPSCCQVIPELRCIDRYGERNELADEPMLSERDFGWLRIEEAERVSATTSIAISNTARGNADGAASGAAGDATVLHSTAVVQPDGAPLSLAALEAEHTARSLIIDFSASGGDVGAAATADALELLPPPAEVAARVKALYGSERRSRHGAKCAQILLEVIEEEEKRNMRKH